MVRHRRVPTQELEQRQVTLLCTDPNGTLNVNVARSFVVGPWSVVHFASVAEVFVVDEGSSRWLVVTLSSAGIHDFLVLRGMRVQPLLKWATWLQLTAPGTFSCALLHAARFT